MGRAAMMPHSFIIILYACNYPPVLPPFPVRGIVAPRYIAAPRGAAGGDGGSAAAAAAAREEGGRHLRCACSQIQIVLRAIQHVRMDVET